MILDGIFTEALRTELLAPADKLGNPEMSPKYSSLPVNVLFEESHNPTTLEPDVAFPMLCSDA